MFGISGGSIYYLFFVTEVFGTQKSFWIKSKSFKLNTPDLYTNNIIEMAIKASIEKMMTLSRKKWKMKMKNEKIMTLSGKLQVAYLTVYIFFLGGGGLILSFC